MPSPHLRRELKLYDLTLLMVVAVVNVNMLPIIAAEGWRAMTLWFLAFLLFLIPLGIAVAQFSKRYPGEGGIYIWTKEMFGEFHAFVSGWCYWTNNLFYIPSVLFILIGVSVYTGGAENAALSNNNHFVAVASIVFLWVVTLLHIRGIGVGKWLNNFGAIGVWLTLLLLVAVGIIVMSKNGGPATPFHWSALAPALRDYPVLSAFSLTMYSLVGLELASVMGDEIVNPARNIPRALLLGGCITIVLYWIGTAAILSAVPSTEVGAIQGVMQAVTFAATGLDLTFIIPFVAGLVSLAVLGICSAWLAGSARIPFVMGLRVFLPPALGKIHPRWNSPYIALLLQGILSSLLILISLYGSNVRDAYGILLSSSVVIQLIPFLYLFGGLWKLRVWRAAGGAGFLATAFGIIFTFIPSSSVENVWLFELKLITGTAIMLGLCILFFSIGKRKVAALG